MVIITDSQLFASSKVWFIITLTSYLLLRVPAAADISYKPIKMSILAHGYEAGVVYEKFVKVKVLKCGGLEAP